MIDKKGTPLKYFLCNGACVGCECRPFHISCRRMIGWPSKAQSSVRTFQLSHLHIYWTCVGLIQAFKTGRSFSIYSEYFPVERLCVQHTRVYRYTVQWLPFLESLNLFQFRPDFIRKLVFFIPSLKMKIICAGFPKTGTKSMASALRQLGYNVNDFPEHLHGGGLFAWSRVILN